MSTWQNSRCQPNIIHEVDVREYTMSTWQNTWYQPDRIHDVNLTEYTMSTWQNTRYQTDRTHDVNLTEHTMSIWQNTRCQPDRTHDVNLTEYTLSTWQNMRCQPRRPKSKRSQLWKPQTCYEQEVFMELWITFRFRDFILVKIKGTLDGRKAFIIYEEKILIKNKRHLTWSSFSLHAKETIVPKIIDKLQIKTLCLIH